MNEESSETRIARLEERLIASEKALVLARESIDKALELARKATDNSFTHGVIVFSVLLSIISLAMQFLKR